MSACNEPPWAIFIPPMDRPEILRIIRQECIDIYGQSYDECPKRLTCFKKTCMGRPLPWESPTARPYLDLLKKTQDIRKKEMFIQTDCSTCPIVNICSSPCNQVLDFIERDRAIEPYMDYKDNLENIKNERIEVYEPSALLFNGADIPWDVLTKRKQEVIKKYLYEGRDFRYVGETLGIKNQARAKYEFYSAITKLAEYANVRDFLKNNNHKLTAKQKEVFNLFILKTKL